MRKAVVIAVLSLALIVSLLGVAALAANPNLPNGCAPCGSEFKGPNSPTCGIAEEPVLSYRANGELIGLFSNRCFGCTRTGAFCTVGAI